MFERLRANAALRLAAFAAFLALVGGVAALAGAATGSKPSATPGGAMGADGGAMEMAAMSPAAQARTNGLATSAAGYTFAPAQTTLPTGTSPYRFRIVDASGSAVHDFDVDGGVRLHLIVVRRDFVGSPHLHPRLEPSGTWAVPLTLAAPGAYRVYADFEVGGEKTVLGQDLFVPGRFVPKPLAAVSATDSIDGYTVRLARAELHAGKETKLHFLVSRNGRPVPRFETYVGHRGHMVALRDGDLAYSHVHPEPTGEPGEIVFHTALSNAGNYRLFLQFKSGGVVHTAPFTVEVAR